MGRDTKRRFGRAEILYQAQKMYRCVNIVFLHEPKHALKKVAKYSRTSLIDLKKKDAREERTIWENVLSGEKRNIENF